MAVFYVSDTQEKNFPVDKNDLKNRLAKIAKGLPDQGDNIKPFVIPALELFRDCGLITKKNIEILHIKSLVWTEENILGQKIHRELDMNPIGGVLRKEGLLMYDDGGNRRYYYDGRVIIFVVFEGVNYYISNDWYSKEKFRPTKYAFYNWLAEKATAACEAKWAEDEFAYLFEEKDFDEPVTKKIPSENNSETEKLLSNLASLVARLDIRVDNMEKILSKIEKDIEELKNEWYGK